MQRIFGEDHEIHAGEVGTCLGDGPHDLRGLVRELVRRRDTGNCSCTRPITTPFGLLLRPPNPFMGSPIG